MGILILSYSSYKAVGYSLDCKADATLYGYARRKGASNRNVPLSIPQGTSR